MKIKKGDHVIVVAGRDRGREGTVIAAYPERDRVLVQGVNMVKKHTKVTQGVQGAKQGGIVHAEAPIHVSNVQIVDPDTKKPARVGYRVDEDGKRSGLPGRAVRTSDASSDERGGLGGPA